MGWCECVWRWWEGGGGARASISRVQVHADGNEIHCLGGDGRVCVHVCALFRPIQVEMSEFIVRMGTVCVHVFVIHVCVYVGRRVNALGPWR